MTESNIYSFFQQIFSLKHEMLLLILTLSLSDQIIPRPWKTVNMNPSVKPRSVSRRLQQQSESCAEEGLSLIQNSTLYFPIVFQMFYIPPFLLKFPFLYLYCSLGFLWNPLFNKSHAKIVGKWVRRVVHNGMCFLQLS